MRPCLGLSQRSLRLRSNRACRLGDYFCAPALTGRNERAVMSTVSLPRPQTTLPPLVVGIFDPAGKLIDTATLGDPREAFCRQFARTDKAKAAGLWARALDDAEEVRIAGRLLAERNKLPPGAMAASLGDRILAGAISAKVKLQIFGGDGDKPEINCDIKIETTIDDDHAAEVVTGLIEHFRRGGEGGAK
jgi:hypothetical protein